MYTCVGRIVPWIRKNEKFLYPVQVGLKKPGFLFRYHLRGGGGIWSEKVPPPLKIDMGRYNKKK